MKQNAGFTVIELLIATVFLIFGGVLFFVQKNNIEVAARDEQRKVSINAVHYSLERAYFPENNSYPASIGDDTLTTMDNSLLSDPSGNRMGTSGSDYRYEPTGCDNDECTGYTLRAFMENEADFVKTHRDLD